MKFEIQNTFKKSRTGVLHTKYGKIQTPVFMPVGTLGTVKVYQKISYTNTTYIISKYLSLMLRPGMEIIKKFGG